MLRLTDLREILRYIPQFRDCVFVISIDGAIVSDDNFTNLMLDIKLLRSLRIGVAIVHGAGLQTRQAAAKEGFRLSNSDGTGITDRADWPLLLEGVTSSSREAQTTAICGGELFTGIWPWGEVWRYNTDADRWRFQQRMFSHPKLSKDIVHPYDVENRGHDVSNLWGQRITSLVTSGDSLFVSTSAKYPCEWNAEAFPFLAEEKWKSYGSVYRMKVPGHLGAKADWTSGATVFEFTVSGRGMTILQDGKRIGSTAISGALAKQLERQPKLKPVRWGTGIYGGFNGLRIDGKLVP